MLGVIGLMGIVVNNSLILLPCALLLGSDLKKNESRFPAPACGGRRLRSTACHEALDPSGTAHARRQPVSASLPAAKPHLPLCLRYARLTQPGSAGRLRLPGSKDISEKICFLELHFLSVNSHVAE